MMPTSHPNRTTPFFHSDPSGLILSGADPDMGRAMKASRVALLGSSLAVVLAVMVAAEAAAHDMGNSSDGSGASGERRHHDRNDWEPPNSYMYEEGRTYDRNGKPYYHPDPGRDRYLRDLRRYNNQPWYKRWRETPPSRYV